MTIAFISNFINHHQVHVADELYKIIGDGYKFIETEPMPDEFIKNGYPDFSQRPYVVKAYSSSLMLEYAKDYAYNADVVVIGSAPEYYVTQRIHDNKLTFRYNERWFKSKPWYLTGIRGWINFYKHHIRYKNKPLYMLCASAFTAKDVNTIGAYKNKCFKWGYFTEVDDSIPYRNYQLSKSKPIRIMWCARFLKLKHPELPILLAKRLKQKGYNFTINMFGSGVELTPSEDLVKKTELTDVVHFCGNRPNDKILDEMKRHDIFLFTSDRNEGWGAVVNEAMSCGCVVVGSDTIGSIPFLINDGINGLIFKSESLDSLEDEVCYLLNNPEKINQLANAAISTMRNVWSPRNAALNLVKLIQSILSGETEDLKCIGPCSKA